MKWYRKAAEQGHGRAQLNLGLMYNNGEGVLKDEAEACVWFTVAAANGHELAKDNLVVARGRLSPEQLAAARHLGRKLFEQINTKKK